MFAYLAVAVPYIAIAILYHLRPNAELRRAARHGRLRMEGDRMIIQREVTHAS
jgi:ubiquinone biosynthesis protein UbiJ